MRIRQSRLLGAPNFPFLIVLLGLAAASPPHSSAQPSGAAISVTPTPDTSSDTGGGGGRSLTLADLLSQAERHPDVVAATTDVDSARGGITAADRAPLPQITASVASIDLQNGLGAGSLAGSKRIDKGVGVDWTWERGNKREHRVRSAEFALEAARYERLEALVQRRLAIAAAYWDLLAAQERETVARESANSAAQTAAVSKTRFEKGDISEQELSRLSIEAERARNELAAVSASREIAAITLAQAAGIKAGDLRAGGTWSSSASSLSRPTSGATQAAQMRFDVKAAQARLMAARASLDLARSLQTTDITWGGGFNNYPPEQRAAVQVRAQFPWQINYQFEGEIRQAAAAVQRSEEMLRLTTQLAISDMLALDLKKDRSAERLALFETQIRAQARQVLQRAEAAYNRGATPLTDLLEARRTHLAVELDAVQARADASRAATEWVLRLEGIAK